jgi:preprotein translocase subunit SecG
LVFLLMIILLLAIHILVAISLVGVVLLQKSEGGALGMGGGGMSGFMTGRSTANLLTRVTAILAAAFMTTSVLLVVLHNRERAPQSIFDQSAPPGPAAPVAPIVPASPQPQTPPSEPAQPSAPLAK